MTSIPTVPMRPAKASAQTGHPARNVSASALAARSTLLPANPMPVTVSRAQGGPRPFCEDNAKIRRFKPGHPENWITVTVIELDYIIDQREQREKREEDGPARNPAV